MVNFEAKLTETNHDYINYIFSLGKYAQAGGENRHSGGQGAGHAIHVRLSIHVINSLCGRVPCYARIHRAMTNIDYLFRQALMFEVTAPRHSHRRH